MAEVGCLVLGEMREFFGALKRGAGGGVYPRRS